MVTFIRALTKQSAWLLDVVLPYLDFRGIWTQVDGVVVGDDAAYLYLYSLSYKNFYDLNAR